MRAKPGNPCRALLQAGTLVLPAALGRAGITSRKREGDGATPRSTMRLMGGFVRGDRRAPVNSPLSLTALRSGMLWCDAPGHAAYNRPVRAPFSASHERLWREDGLYDVCLVLDWNLTQRRRGGGSAIFFHLARGDYGPTEGCIAISLRDMRRLLPCLGPGTRVTVL